VHAVHLKLRRKLSREKVSATFLPRNCSGESERKEQAITCFLCVFIRLWLACWWCAVLQLRGDDTSTIALFMYLPLCTCPLANLCSIGVCCAGGCSSLSHVEMVRDTLPYKAGPNFPVTRVLDSNNLQPVNGFETCMPNTFTRFVVLRAYGIIAADLILRSVAQISSTSVGR
jgi:hypothetical protein